MNISVEENISLAEYTTLKVGGVARYFTVLKKQDDLLNMVDFANSAEVPIFVLGGGSNVLIAEGELPRLVIKNELKGVEFTADEKGDTLVIAAAGEGWDELVSETVKRGLSGLENLSGIPGTVGAAPIQNINAYGTSVAESIETVTAFDVISKTTRTLSVEECRFGYRDSLFKQAAGAPLIVTSVTFKFMPAGKINLNYRSASQSIERYLSEQGVAEPTAADIRQAVLQVRKNIGMVDGCFRSAGSFFKNTILSAEEFTRVEEIVNKRFPETSDKYSPWHWDLSDGTVKVSTAFLMECTPYNKHTYGTKRWHEVVGLSPLHSLSIVTECGATATDVHDFADMIIKEVKNIFGITIQTEVNFISN